MRFTEYNGRIKRTYHNAMTKLEGELKEFIKMNVKVAKVHYTEHEYRHAKACYESLRKATKRLALPVDVITRKGEVFLVNKEID